MSTQKTYTVRTVCPDCGGARESAHGVEEMERLYGSARTVGARCEQCLKDYENEMRTACLEWDEVCQMQTSRRG